MSLGSLVYKVADTLGEFRQIHDLNYRTFVEEVGQHPPNRMRRRIDRFHDENTYYICLAGDRLIGMACTRDRRPFSRALQMGEVMQPLHASAAMQKKPSDRVTDPAAPSASSSLRPESTRYVLVARTRPRTCQASISSFACS